MIGLWGPPSLARDLAIQDITVIDVHEGKAIPGLTVLVSNGEIGTVGPNQEVEPKPETRRLDGHGKFLIPGLMDMHVHWYDAEFFEHFIAHGVTGIRQMWGNRLLHSLEKARSESRLVAPRMVIGSSIIDGDPPNHRGAVGCNDADCARQAVRHEAETGAAFVKVYSLLPREAFFAVADEAKKLGLPLVGHVPFGVTTQEAIDAGMASIEHLRELRLDMSTKAHVMRQKLVDTGGGKAIGKLMGWDDELARTYDEKQAETLIKSLAENKVWQCPTLIAEHIAANLDEPGLADDPRRESVPSALRNRWRIPEITVKRKHHQDRLRRSFARNMALVGTLHKAGVPILAGSDCFNAFVYPGSSLHEELALLVEAGLSPLEALRSATSRPAQFLGRQDLGRIAPGAIADLVVLDANPLEDIKNTTRIHAVIADGVLYGAPARAAMLTRLKALGARKTSSDVSSTTQHSPAPETESSPPPTR